MTSSVARPSTNAGAGNALPQMIARDRHAYLLDSYAHVETASVVYVISASATASNYDCDRMTLMMDDMRRGQSDDPKHHIPFYRPLYANLKPANRFPRNSPRDMRSRWQPLMGNRPMNRTKPR